MSYDSRRSTRNYTLGLLRKAALNAEPVGDYEIAFGPLTVTCEPKSGFFTIAGETVRYAENLIERLRELAGITPADVAALLTDRERENLLDLAADESGCYEHRLFDLLLAEPDYCTDLGDCSNISEYGEKVAATFPAD